MTTNVFHHGRDLLLIAVDLTGRPGAERAFFCSACGSDAPIHQLLYYEHERTLLQGKLAIPPFYWYMQKKSSLSFSTTRTARTTGNCPSTKTRVSAFLVGAHVGSHLTDPLTNRTNQHNHRTALPEMRAFTQYTLHPEALSPCPQPSSKLLHACMS